MLSQEIKTNRKLLNKLIMMLDEPNVEEATPEVEAPAEESVETPA